MELWPAIVLGSLLFSAMHLDFQPWWIIDKFIFAAVSAYALEKTGSIVPGIVSHVLTNTLVFVLLICAG